MEKGWNGKIEKITYKDIKKNEEINTLIDMGNEALGVMGFTDHSRAHAVKVAEVAAQILKELGYSKEDIELAKITGYMHDIGNAVNRTNHAHHGAVMAFEILRSLGMDVKNVAAVVSAIGNHDEKTGTAVHPISAAIIIADKTDVRRNRVRNKDRAQFDMHDRVNYAVKKSRVSVHKEKAVIHLDIELDEEICSVLDYFEIFLERMLMCRRAAEMLNLKFKFTVNHNKVL